MAIVGIRGSSCSSLFFSITLNHINPVVGYPALQYHRRAATSETNNLPPTIMDTTNTPSFTVQPQTPQRQIRHRNSLEHILTFTLKSPLPLPHEVSEAILLYHLIFDDCEAASVVLRKPRGDGDTANDANADALDELEELDDMDGNIAPSHEDDLENEVHDGSTVPLHQLFRAIYEHSPTADGRVNVVRIAVHGMFPVENHEDPNQGRPGARESARSKGRQVGSTTCASSVSHGMGTSVSSHASTTGSTSTTCASAPVGGSSKSESRPRLHTSCPTRSTRCLITPLICTRQNAPSGESSKCSTRA